MTEVIVRSSRRLYGVVNGIQSLWERTQASRHGAYTTRRARALQRYVQSTSFVRLLVVCVLTPVPILAFVLLQELLPLAAPDTGWKANYRWFVRSAIIFMILTLSYIRQGVIFLDPLKVSVRQTIVITLLTTAAYFTVLVLLSSFWGFPIPFSCVLTTGVFTCLAFGFFVAVIGWRTLTNTPRFLSHARILRRVLVVETVMVMVYPAFNAAFRLLRGIHQIMFLLVLFLFKVIMRLAMVRALRLGKGGKSIEERWRARLPEIVVFSAELFHVLYLTACLQSRHVMISATIGLSLLDVSISMINLRRLLQRSVRGLLSSLDPKLAAPTRSALNIIVPSSPRSSFSRIATTDTNSSWWFSSHRQGSSVNSASRSCSTSRHLPRVMAGGGSNMKLSLARRSSSRSSTHSNDSSSRLKARVSFTSSATTAASNPPAHDIPPEIFRLQTLSMAEYFLLVEYVKCIIPAMYGIFQGFLAGLPNAAYYPPMTRDDLHRAQTSMVVFVAIHSFFFAIYMLLLRRHVRYSVIHQLAFVLETAADDIQAKLAIFIPYCFYFFLEHNGVDYSFEFVWMDTGNQA